MARPGRKLVSALGPRAFYGTLWLSLAAGKDEVTPGPMLCAGLPKTEKIGKNPPQTVGSDQTAERE